MAGTENAPDTANRPLTPEERQLIAWMLEHGKPEARNFLPQLELAKVTSWVCRCGCASFHLVIDGHDKPSGGMQIIADFVFGDGDDICGIFAYAQDGLLSGIEVYGFAVDAPKKLPSPTLLRPFVDGAS